MSVFLKLTASSQNVNIADSKIYSEEQKTKNNLVGFSKIPGPNPWNL